MLNTTMTANGFEKLYKELAFFPTMSQSNIYNLTALPSQPIFENNPCTAKYDIFCACLLPTVECEPSNKCCNIYSFNSNFEYVKLFTMPIDFVYLPISDIVCINALYDMYSQEYLVGIGFVKKNRQSFFNIYGASTKENVPDFCISFSELSYVPLQVKATYYISPTNKRFQWAFILACGNASSHSQSTSNYARKNRIGAVIQVYALLSDSDVYLLPVQEEIFSFESTSIDSTYQGSHSNKNISDSGDSFESLHRIGNLVNTTYGELDFISANRLFPELNCLPFSTISYMDFVILKGDTPLRLSTFGSIDGWIGVGITDMNKPTLIHFFSCTHDSPITYLNLFCQFPKSSQRLKKKKINCVEESENTADDFSLLVCSGLEPAVVYRNVYQYKRMSAFNQTILPNSNDFDHVNCACIGDLDFDGKPEIVVGTFDEHLLFYKWFDEDSLLPIQPTNSLAANINVIHSGHYEFVYKRKVSGQVHCLMFGYDFIGDGCLCLAFLTSNGLHLLQCQSDKIMNLIEERLDNLSVDSVYKLSD